MRKASSADDDTIPSARRPLVSRMNPSSISVNLAAFETPYCGSSSDILGGLNLWEVAICMEIYADCMLIVQSVHDADVLHFDIKASNFIFRCDPDLELMRTAHAKGQPSGIIFLADFGEAIPHASEAVFTGVGPSVASRSRGTLPIQSPEMLALTQSGGGGGGAGAATTTTSSATAATAAAAGAVTTALAAGSSSSTKTSKITFPSPGVSSDIWSLGCLFVELLTEKYLFADRPWTDLYVSLCMDKFQPLPLDNMRKYLSALKQSSANALEDLLVKTLKQDPLKRMPINQMFTEMMSIISKDSSQSL